MVKYIELGLYYSVKKNIPKINEIRIIRNFLIIIRNSDLHFLIIYNVKFNKGELTDTFKLTKLFKQFYKLNYI